MKIIRFGSEDSSRVIIWLHGLGAGSEDEAFFIYRSLNVEAEFIFPIAPFRPVSWVSGNTLTAWFDMDGEGRANLDDLKKSVKQISELVENNFLDKSIILAGFSQGAVLAIQCWMEQQVKFDRVLALSGWLADRQFKELSGKELWMGHGKRDQVVPVDLGMQSAEYLKKCGANVNFHLYDMGHEVCLAEMADMRAFIA